MHELKMCQMISQTLQEAVSERFLLWELRPSTLLHHVIQPAFPLSRPSQICPVSGCIRSLDEAGFRGIDTRRLPVWRGVGAP